MGNPLPKNQSKPTILFLGNFPSYARGSHSVSEELALHLRDKGFSVITASHRDGRFARLLDMLQTIWQRRTEYDVAHIQVFSGLAFIWAEATAALLQALGKPYLLTLHGGNLPAFSKQWPRRVARLLNSAAHVTTPSRYLFETMQPYCSQLEVIPNALDIAKYQFRQRVRAEPTLVWLRAFHEIYNPSLAAHVLARILPAHPNAKLLMYGPDKADGSLNAFKKTAAKHGITAHIEIKGAVLKEDVPLHISQGDIFLNTTNIDNTPSSVIEAMACGLCVVSTNVGGVPYLLTNETDALLVPPDNVEAMSSAVHSLLNDPRLAARLSVNARAKVTGFDWSKILQRWSDLFIATVTKRVASSRI